MGYTEHGLWLDDPEAERDERIGEHEAYGTLYDLANTRYLGNNVPWPEAMEAFVKNGADDPEWLHELLSKRLRVVPRCHCDQTLYGGEEWAGPRHEILREAGGAIDYEATETAVLRTWRVHIETHRTALSERQAAAAKQRGGYLVALDTIGKLDGMERFGAIRTARAALDAVEIEAVVQERHSGKSWTEIAVQMGISRQAARERFMKHDPQGAEAA